MSKERVRRTWYVERAKKRRRTTIVRWVLIGGAALALVAVVLGLAALRPNAPGVTPEMVAEGKAANASLQAERQAKADEKQADKAAALEPVKLDVKRPAEGSMRVLFAGDSLTYGLFATKQSNGFRPRMVRALSKDGEVEEFRGEKSGAGAGDVASIIDVPSDLDLAIIELGTNDVGAQTPIAEFTKTYAALLDKIRDKTPGVPLLCVGTWGSDGGGYGSDPYNEAIEKECVARDGKFVSMYGVYPVEANRGPAGLAMFGGVSDDFHPNDKGYEAIADLLLGSLNVS